jgi:hypothetical protein
MESINQIKADIKEKWLDYYKTNQEWIQTLTLHQGRAVKTVDNITYYRPPAEFILGVISALDPRINDCLIFFTQLSNDRNKLIESLGLNFDPEDELEKREKEKEKKSETPNLESKPPSALSDTEYLDQIRQKMNQTE